MQYRSYRGVSERGYEAEGQARVMGNMSMGKGVCLGEGGGKAEGEDEVAVRL